MILGLFQHDSVGQIAGLQRLIGHRHAGHLDCGRINRLFGAAPALPFVYLTDARPKGLFGCPLHLQTQRRMDLQAALVHHGLAVLRDQLINDLTIASSCCQVDCLGSIVTIAFFGKIKARLAGQGGDIREPDWGPANR